LTKVKYLFIISMLEFSNKNFLLFSMSATQITEYLIELELNNQITPYTLEEYTDEQLEAVLEQLVAYTNVRQVGFLRDLYTEVKIKIDKELSERKHEDFTEAEEPEQRDNFVDNFIDVYA